MENSHASPGLLKQANSSALHRVLREKGAATRAQLAAAAGVSVTTVRALLEEMLRDGEVERTGLSASSGGRRAAQYSLRRDKYYGAAVCITDGQAHGLLVDVHGEIVRAVPLKAGADGLRTPVLAFLDGLFAQKISAPLAWDCPAWCGKAAFGMRIKKADCTVWRWSLLFRGVTACPSCWKTTSTRPPSGSPGATKRNFRAKTRLKRTWHICILTEVVSARVLWRGAA